MPDMEKRTKKWDWVWLIVLAVVLVLVVWFLQPPGPLRTVKPTPTSTVLVWTTATQTATQTPRPTRTPDPTSTPVPTVTDTPAAEPIITPTVKSPTATPDPTPTPRTYALLHDVQPGDWLSTIAAHYYDGDWERWPEILELTNKAARSFPRSCLRYIDNPDLIFPGDCVLVPIGGK